MSSRDESPDVTEVGEAGGNSYLVRAILRAFDVLEEVRKAGDGISLKELSSRAGLTKPTTLRMVRNLEHVGMIEGVPGTNSYRLGVRCVELGEAYLEHADFRHEARPILERLRDQIGETVHLGVLDDGLRVVYLDKLEGSHAVGIMMSRVGATAPAFCTGLGKALLAAQGPEAVARLDAAGPRSAYTSTTIVSSDELQRELALTRERGYALDLEEHEPGVRCVASTIPGLEGPVTAAISIAGPAHRLSRETLEGELSTAVMTAAADIGRRLGVRSAGEEGGAHAAGGA